MCLLLLSDGTTLVYIIYNVIITDKNGGQYDTLRTQVIMNCIKPLKEMAEQESLFFIPSCNVREMDLVLYVLQYNVLYSAPQNVLASPAAFDNAFYVFVKAQRCRRTVKK